MAYIELVIKIPEEEYNYVKTQVLFGNMDSLKMRIANGTPLPKGHGRLIDADALKMDKRVCGDRYLSNPYLFVANAIIEQATTIIEADKAKSEE